MKKSFFPFCIHDAYPLGHSYLSKNYSCRRPGGEKIYYVFDNQFPVALKRLQFDKNLSMENVRKLITQADGYQPHLIAPEQGYRHLIESCLVSIRGPAEAAVDAVCYMSSFLLIFFVIDYYISPVVQNLTLFEHW